MFLISSAAYGWDVRGALKDHSNKYYIIYSGKGVNELGVEISKEERKLTSISFRNISVIDSNEMQKEIASYLLTNYSEIYTEVLNSSGNLYNPKLQAIKEPLKEAIRKTSYIESVNKILRKNGYEISSVSILGELLTYEKIDDNRVFSTSMWLSVKQLTNRLM